MNTLNEMNPNAMDLWFSREMLYVRLEDGREVGTPLDWFPKLKSASEIQRSHWRFIGQGVGIHWEDIDEDISVRKLIFG
jgi:hypothetical protein